MTEKKKTVASEKEKTFSEEEVQAVVAEIKRLPKDKAHWTTDGKPDAKALSERCGFAVSSALRDEAFGLAFPKPLKNVNGIIRGRRLTFITKPVSEE